MKKLKQKKDDLKKELTPIQFILFLPIATFSMLLLLGLFSSGFKPEQENAKRKKSKSKKNKNKKSEKNKFKLPLNYLRIRSFLI